MTNKEEARIEWTKRAFKQLKSIPESQKIYEAVQVLKNWPRCQNVRKLADRDDYRFRIGRYRVFFTVRDGQPVIIRIEQVKNEMSRLTNYQIINSESGEPLFAVIPYSEFQQIRKHLEDDELTLPNKVVGLHILEGKSLLCAWREYKGISPDEMAEGMGMTRDEYLQTENKKILSSYTLKKAADLLGTDSRLLTED